MSNQPRKSSMNKHIFISYARIDGAQYAETIYKDLENRGIKSWLDVYNISGGMNWNAAIDKGLQNAKGLVVILTAGSNSSIQVESEWNDAINRYLPIFPLIFEDCEIPRVLHMLNWIDFQSDYNTGFNSVVSGINNLENGHLEYLNKLLENYIRARNSSIYPERFQYKIDKLREEISKQSIEVSVLKKILREQDVRIKEDLNVQQAIIKSEAIKRRAMARSKVVGQRLLDISDHFLNRHIQRKKLGNLLAEPSTRIISVIGRGGIGKTAIVSKVLEDLESGKWNYTEEKIDVDGIVYLSTRTKGINLERIYLDCAEMLGGDQEEWLLKVWTNPRLVSEEKTQELLKMLNDGSYIILLDNIEDLLDLNNHIIDPELNAFFEISLRTSHNVKLLLTSREVMKLPKELLKFDNHILIEEGLPPDDAISMLKLMDPNANYGLKNNNDEILKKIAEKVHGIPRALEIVASILANDPFISLDDLIGQDLLFEREEFLDELVRENFKRLDEDSHKIMEALAIFDRPVPLVAIEFLVSGFSNITSIKDKIRRLIHVNVIKIDRENKELSFHPIDRDYVYGLLHNDQEYYSELESRVSKYYSQIRLPISECYSLKDFEYHFLEIDHAIKAKNFKKTAKLIKEIDDILLLWGHVLILLKYREVLYENISNLTKDQQIDNLFKIATYHFKHGYTKKAIVFYKKCFNISSDDFRKIECLNG